MKNIGTHPFIIDALVMPVHDRGQTTFRENVPPKSDDTSNTLYALICEAATDQDCIGFYPIFEGHISAKWQSTQELSYREQTRCRKQGKFWAKQIINRLYSMTRLMWKHCNDALYNNQVAEVSYKRRKAVIWAVKTQIKIGFQYIRLKDRQTICKKCATLKKMDHTYDGGLVEPRKYNPGKSVMYATKRTWSQIIWER